MWMIPCSVLRHTHRTHTHLTVSWKMGPEVAVNQKIVHILSFASGLPQANGQHSSARNKQTVAIGSSLRPTKQFNMHRALEKEDLQQHGS